MNDKLIQALISTRNHSHTQHRERKAHHRLSSIPLVVKPFDGRDEEDRRRATQILDYIIEKKKTISKIKEDRVKTKKDEEQKMLLS